MIKGVPLTAYEIRCDLVKNVHNKQDEFHVDPAYREPLIDYAFFLPKPGSIFLSHLIFRNIRRLKYKLPVIVREQLKSKINMRADYNLQLLPESLLKIIGKEAFEPPMTKMFNQMVKDKDLPSQGISANCSNR